MTLTIFKIKINEIAKGKNTEEDSIDIDNIINETLGSNQSDSNNPFTTIDGLEKVFLNSLRNYNNIINGYLLIGLTEKKINLNSLQEFEKDLDWFKQIIQTRKKDEKQIIYNKLFNFNNNLAPETIASVISIRKNIINNFKNFINTLLKGYIKRHSEELIKKGIIKLHEYRVIDEIGLFMDKILERYEFSTLDNLFGFRKNIRNLSLYGKYDHQTGNSENKYLFTNRDFIKGLFKYYKKRINIIAEDIQEEKQWYYSHGGGKKIILNKGEEEIIKNLRGNSLYRQENLEILSNSLDDNNFIRLLNFYKAITLLDKTFDSLERKIDAYITTILIGPDNTDNNKKIPKEILNIVEEKKGLRTLIEEQFLNRTDNEFGEKKQAINIGQDGSIKEETILIGYKKYGSIKLGEHNLYLSGEKKIRKLMVNFENENIDTSRQVERFIMNLHSYNGLTLYNRLKSDLLKDRNYQKLIVSDITPYKIQDKKGIKEEINKKQYIKPEYKLNV